MIKPIALNLVVLMTLPLAAHARDDRQRYSVADALNTVAAKEKLGTDVKFYFGSQPHAKVQQSFGVDQSNRKTNGVGKTDKEACEWAFLSAMIAFKDAATRRGANAVINMHSNYKGVEFVSDTEYECGSGGIMSGVTIKGELVKLAQ